MKIKTAQTLLCSVLSFGLANLVILAESAPQAEEDVVSLGELLEEGIYLQETENAFDEAIEVYKQLIAAGRPFEAEALYRTGLCYLALGRPINARAAFQKVVDNFPDEGTWVEAAKSHLPGEFKPLPPPWQDGERLIMRVKLPGGATVYDQRITVQKKEWEGKLVWRFDNRLFGMADGHSYSYVDPETFRPIFSHWYHSSLGDADAWFTEENVTIRFKDKPEPLIIETDGIVFDNDQTMSLARQLPFEVGKSWKISLLPILTGQKLELELLVADQETLSVPAGEFDCYRLEIRPLNQTLWYSVDAPHYLVRYGAGGVAGELIAIETAHPGETRTYASETLGISLRVPDEWFTFEFPDKKETVRLVDPDATGKSRIEIKPVSSFSDESVESLDSIVDYIIGELGRQFESFEVREDATEQTELAGIPAISFVADYLDIKGSGMRTRREVVAIRETEVMSVISDANAEDYDSYQASIDAIISSIEWQ